MKRLYSVTYTARVVVREIHEASSPAGALRSARRRGTPASLRTRSAFWPDPDQFSDMEVEPLASESGGSATTSEEVRTPMKQDKCDSCGGRINQQTGECRCSD